MKLVKITGTLKGSQYKNGQYHFSFNERETFISTNKIVFVNAIYDDVDQSIYDALHSIKGAEFKKLKVEIDD